MVLQVTRGVRLVLEIAYPLPIVDLKSLTLILKYCLSYGWPDKLKGENGSNRVGPGDFDSFM